MINTISITVNPSIVFFGRLTVSLIIPLYSTALPESLTFSGWTECEKPNVRVSISRHFLELFLTAVVKSSKNIHLRIQQEHFWNTWKQRVGVSVTFLTHNGWNSNISGWRTEAIHVEDFNSERQWDFRGFHNRGWCWWRWAVNKNMWFP